MAAKVSEAMVPADRLSAAVSGLEPDSAASLRAAFEEMFAQAEEWTARAREIRVTSVDQKREMKLARESRLALREIRVKAEHARKRLKEDSLRRGRAIDGIANVIKALIEPIEAHLLEQETFAKRAEEARREQMRRERADALRAYGADQSAYADLGAASDETWASILETTRVAHEAKLEAERQAEAVRVEAERIAAAKREEERQAQIRAEAERVAREKAQAEENARLRREAEEREAAAAAERARLKAEADAREAAARAEREAAEAEARKAREEADRVAAELEAERQRAADEARRREEEEAARVAAEQAAREAAALAPDKDKLTAFAEALRALDVPALSTAKGQAAGSRIAEQIAKLAGWVERTAEALS